MYFKRVTIYICNFSMFSNSQNNMHKFLAFVFNILKVFYKMQLSFYTTIILLFWCDVYSGSIWEWKFLNYRETVQRLFRNEERNFKASSQKIFYFIPHLYTESASDAVQVFANEWSTAYYMCWICHKSLWK